jgi:hypothetical protein
MPRTLLTLLTGCLLLAGCGGRDITEGSLSSPTPAQVSASDPCSVLTPAEVVGILGNPILDTIREQGTEGARSCTYLGDPNGAHIYFYGERLGQAGFDAVRRVGEKISGVGDEAYWTAALETLDIRKGSSYFAVQAIGKERARDLEIAKSLAQVLTRRL